MREFLLITILLLAGGVAHAAGESRMKIEKPSASTNDLDAEVTDAKLRADSGSKSKWSGSFTFNYSGGSVADPFSEERPRLGNRRPEPVNMTGSFGARYRFNKNESIYLATGFSQVKPFHEQNEIEVYNPRISYNNTFAHGRYQLGNAFDVTVLSREQDRFDGSMGSLGYALYAIAPLPYAGLTGGVTAAAWYVPYRTGVEDPRLKGRYIPIEYGFSLAPHVKYNFNSRVNVNTYVAILTMNHHRGDEHLRMTKADIEQGIGIGWAPVRDVYINPYANFKWKEAAADKATINLAATINIF